MADTATQAMQARKVSPMERAVNFARATRKYEQVAVSQTKLKGETVRIQLDKVRLASKIKLLVEVDLTAVHAANTSYTPAWQAPYTLLRNIRMTTNLSFVPWLSSGIGAFMLMHGTPDVAPLIQPVYGLAAQAAADIRKWAYQGNVASSGAGTVNKLVFEVDFPIAVNERDPIGLILTQNQETTVNLEIDLGTETDLIGTGQTGYTFTLGAITVTPLVESFSVPPVGEAIPDLTIIKQISEETVNTTAGRFLYRIPTGATYRRIMFQLADGSGNPVDDATLNGPFELVVNTSDVVTRYPAKLLARRNAEIYGLPLPRGMWALDFSYQGVVSYGGSRDYFDTERLTELALVINGPAAYNLRVVSETLARMGG